MRSELDLTPPTIAGPRDRDDFYHTAMESVSQGVMILHGDCRILFANVHKQCPLEIKQ